MNQFPHNTIEYIVESGPLRDAYLLLGAKTPQELDKKYTEEDQKLMKSNGWDYKNKDLAINKVKDILENCDQNLLTEEEKHWTQNILWFWYHHAISCAIVIYQDRDMAKLFAKKAVDLLDEENPNQITMLLYLLAHDRLDEAIKYIENMKDKTLSDGTLSPEKETALYLLEEYRKNKFGLD